MGTRSLTLVYNECGDALINMYRQFDGYPTGHGAELADFLDKPIVNGYSDASLPQFNGAGCLAAQLISNFKKDCGGFYLYPVGERDVWQEYEYHVRVGESALSIEVIAGDSTIFVGTLAEFREWCKSDHCDDE